MRTHRYVTVAGKGYFYRPGDGKLTTPTHHVLGHVERLSARCWRATTPSGASTHHATRDSAFRWLVGGFQGIGIFFASAKTILRAERAGLLR